MNKSLLALLIGIACAFGLSTAPAALAAPGFAPPSDSVIGYFRTGRMIQGPVCHRPKTVVLVAAPIPPSFTHDKVGAHLYKFGNEWMVAAIIKTAQGTELAPKGSIRLFVGINCPPVIH